MVGSLMKLNSNTWHRRRYRLWAPFYDLLIFGFEPYRRRSLAQLRLAPGERVLIVGAGTGRDLEWLPRGVAVTAIDITDAMLDRLRARARRRDLSVEVRLMDGQNLEFGPGAFDAVILHLILAVIPDPGRCAREVARVLRPGGRAVIYDKFIPDTGPTALWVRWSASFASLFGTEIDRRLGPILAGTGLELLHRERAGPLPMFQIALVRKS